MFVLGLYRLSIRVSLPGEFMMKKGSEITRLMLFRAAITLEDNTGEAKKNTVSDFIFFPDNFCCYSHSSRKILRLTHYAKLCSKIHKSSGPCIAQFKKSYIFISVFFQKIKVKVSKSILSNNSNHFLRLFS